jgi:pimeloyl-ACP methyl ester carboxylesterase
MHTDDAMHAVADDGVRIACTVAGEGKRRLLLVHGWMVSSAVWSDVIPALVAQGFAVAAPDLRGAGASDRPQTGYTVDRHVADMEAVVRALGWERCTVVGHSMGGAIAQRFAQRNHGLLDAQVLIAPVPADGVTLPPDVVEDFRGATASPDVAEHFLREYVSAPLSDERWRSMVADSCGVTRAAVSEGLDAWRSCAFADELDGIDVPTLVIGGADDPNFTPDVLRDRVVSRWPGARLVVLDGANHYVPTDAPAAVARAIADLLAELDGSASRQSG